MEPPTPYGDDMTEIFDISDTDDEVTGEHACPPIADRMTIDVEPHVYDRIHDFAERTGLTLDLAIELMLSDPEAAITADPSPLQVAIANLEELSKAVYARTVERDAAVSALASMVEYVLRIGGYMAPEDQVTLNAAKDLLAKNGVLA